MIHFLPILVQSVVMVAAAFIWRVPFSISWYRYMAGCFVLCTGFTIAAHWA